MGEPFSATEQALVGLAVVGVVFSALNVTVLSGALPLLLMALLAFAMGILFFMQYESLDTRTPPAERRYRNRVCVLLGVVLVGLAVAGTFGFAPVTGENIDTTAISETVPERFAGSLGLWMMAAVLVFYWRAYAPAWLPILLAAVVAIGIILYLGIPEEDFATPTGTTMGAALVVLLASAPAVFLRWNPFASSATAAS